MNISNLLRPEDHDYQQMAAFCESAIITRRLLYSDHYKTKSKKAHWGEMGDCSWTQHTHTHTQTHTHTHTHTHTNTHTHASTHTNTQIYIYIYIYIYI